MKNSTTGFNNGSFGENISLHCSRSIVVSITDKKRSKPISNESIAIVENKGQMDFIKLAGESAENNSVKPSLRKFGVNLDNKDYLSLLKARAAMTLGEGNHNVNLSIIAPDDDAEKLVEHFGSNTPTEWAINKIQESLSNIEFISGNVTSTHTKSCSVKIENLQIITESEAVMNIAPEKLNSCLLLQIGHGDLQMSEIRNGKLVEGSTHRENGLQYPMMQVYNQRFKNCRVSFSDFIYGWKNDNTLSSESDVAQVDNYSFSDEKEGALESYFYSTLPNLENNFELNEYPAMIISGGGANDEMIVEMLNLYYKDRFPVYTISQVTSLLNEDKLEIPNQYSASLGALYKLNADYPTNNTTNLALDVGNGFSKSAISK